MRTTLTAIALVTGTLLGTASTAHAEAPDETFCAQAPKEMLAALDGTWTVSQGPGVAVAGGFTGNPVIPKSVMTIPLPPHKGKRFKIAFDPENGKAVLSGDGQKLDMIAASSKELNKVSRHLDGEDLKGMVDKKAGCDWYSLPIMVGSKMYRLKGVEQGGKPTWSMFLPIPKKPMYICLREDGRVAGEFLGGTSECWTEPYEVDAKGDMKMSVIVKFQSATSGGGMLYFEGKSGSYPFAAAAPIKFSR
ncbi:MAG: hypothetical protein KDE32_09565 [Novosphingobium sp.]|nr:hypothetical protein [Novosphingobium sp.]